MTGSVRGLLVLACLLGLAGGGFGATRSHLPVACPIEAAPPPDINGPVVEPSPAASSSPIPPAVYDAMFMHRPWHRSQPTRARRVPFQVKAWAYDRGPKQVPVKRIHIEEVGNYQNGVSQLYYATFAEQVLTLATARSEARYSVFVEWADGTSYRNSYRLWRDSGMAVTISQPN